MLTASVRELLSFNSLHDLTPYNTKSSLILHLLSLMETLTDTQLGNFRVVLPNLSISDILSLRIVSKRFKQLIDSDAIFWKTLSSRYQFGVQGTALLLEITN